MSSVDRPPYDLSGVRAALVEDNEPMALLVTEVLMALGLRKVQRFADVESAWTALAAGAVDLLLLDMVVGEVGGGLTLLRRVRGSDNAGLRQLPVIVLSGYTEQEAVLSARDAGANEFLAKPVSPAGLYSRIVAVLTEPRPFVIGETYIGPERRRSQRPFDGPDRRKVTSERPA
jgi:two-component system chemotaxis response regulator CheY